MNPISAAAPRVNLEQGGVYFFKSPITVTTQLNHEILVVFAVPSIRSCGLVLLEAEMPQRVVEGMFDNLRMKLAEEMKVAHDQIRLKIFGQSFRRRRSLRYVESWSVANQIPITVMDVGKNVTRNVLVDCATGRVGVSYAEGFTQDDPAFLSLGSVRLRETTPAGSHEILVLSTNRVRRTLVKQAIEEHVGYRANCPRNPMQIIALNDFRDFFAGTVFLFDDLDHSELLATWISNAAKYYPKLKFGWVGKDGPPFALPGGSVHLPHVDPEKISGFKGALISLLPKTDAVGGRVIPFQKK
ncbi:MAG: hypothetical protein HYZ71_00305 [Deltaproteobacteria bacterium]|nr:hypothetical protein [Deltaproteobacteria bacterium]